MIESHTVIVGLGGAGVAEGVPESRSLEDPSVPLTDPETFYDEFSYWSGPKTQSGIRVSHSGALRYSAVWQGVSMISGDIAKLPLRVYRRTGDGERKPDKRHQSYKLVRRRANMRTSAYHFWRQMIADAILWPGGYALIDQDLETGKIDGLLPLLPDRTYYDYEIERYVTEVDGSLVKLFPEQVLHIRGLATSLGVCDPVDNFREAIGLGLAAEGFQSKFFKHGTKAGGILELPAAMSKRSRDTVEEGWRRGNEGPDNWYKTVILRDGAKFHQTTISARDSQTTELREDQVRDIARFMNLAPSRLGLSDSVSHNSKSEDNQGYLDTTLSPWLESIAAECWMKLLSKRQQDADSHFYEHETKALLKLNALQRSQVYHNGIVDGWMTRAHAARAENLPAPDELQEYLVPLNMGPASEASPADEEEADRHALRRVVFAMGDEARARARKGKRSWQMLLAGPFASKYTELAGESGRQLIGDAVAQLLKADESDLVDQVDRIMTSIERSV